MRTRLPRTCMLRCQVKSGRVPVDGQAGPPLEHGQAGGLRLDPDLPPRWIRPVRNPDGDRKAVRGQPAQDAGFVLCRGTPSAGPRPASRRRRAVRLGRLLDVARADLLQVGVVDRGLLRQVAVGPDEDPLGADLDVDPCVVPVEQPAQGLGRVHLLGRRKLLAGFAACSDPRSPSDPRRRWSPCPGRAPWCPLVNPGSGRVGEQEGDARDGRAHRRPSSDSRGRW